MSFNTVSLFAGCDGLVEGMNRHPGDLTDRTGTFEVVWGNDADRDALDTIAHNHDDLAVTEDTRPRPGKLSCADIKTVPFSPLDASGVDLVCGGFPCKDFSITRGDTSDKGITVQRGRLYQEMVRALAVLQPAVFVAENVPNLLNANNGQAYRTILDDIENLNDNWSTIQSNLDVTEPVEDPAGYEFVFADVLNASDYGVPQHRRRLIMIGLRRDYATAIEHDHDADCIRASLGAMNNQTVRAPLTPIETFRGRPLQDCQDLYRNEMKRYENYVPYMIDDELENLDIETSYARHNGLVETDDGIREPSRYAMLETLGYTRSVNTVSCGDDSQTVMDEQDNIIERLKRIPPGHNYEAVEDTQYEVGGMMSNVYRRLHPLEPSPTVLAAGGGGTWGYHWRIDRQKLTNRERARLQAFPDDYEFVGSNRSVRSQIGNAVPPRLGSVIGRAVEPMLDYCETHDPATNTPDTCDVPRDVRWPDHGQQRLFERS